MSSLLACLAEFIRVKGIRFPFRKVLLRGLAGLLSGLVLLILVLGGLVSTETGSRFLADGAGVWSQGRLIVSGWQGRLSGSWRVSRLELHLQALNLQVETLALDWRPWALAKGRLDIDRLALRCLSIQSPASDEPLRSPASLELPWALNVGNLELDELRLVRQPSGEDLVFRDLRASFENRHGAHVLRTLSVLTPWGLMRGNGRIAEKPPFALFADLELAAMFDAKNARIQAKVEGHLLRSRVRLRAVSEAAQGLVGDADLHVQAFESLPLSRAWVSVRGFNPSVFEAKAPKALLDLQADLRSSFLADPARRQGPGIEDIRVSGPITLTNRVPGLVEDNALPIEALRGRLDWARGRLGLSGLLLSLPGKGRVEGDMAWMPDKKGKSLALGRIEAALGLSEIAPARISRQAKSMRIRGRIEAEGGKKAQTFDLSLAAEDMSLVAQGGQSAGVLSIQQARLSAGSAWAEASGTLALTGDRAFTLEGHLSHFDPKAFLKDSPSGDLNASLVAKGRLLPDWGGQGSLKLAPSRFAGHPLEGLAEARFSPGRLSEAHIDLAVLGNRLLLSGAFGLPADSLNFELEAPHLERLGGDLDGSLKGSGLVSGGLSNPHGSLSIKASGLRGPGAWRLGRLDLEGRLQPGADGRFELQASAQDLSKDGKNWVGNLSLKGGGSRAHHDVTLSAGLPGSHKLSAHAVGAWQGGLWQGVLQEFALRGDLDFTLEKPTTLSLSAQKGRLGEARLIGGREGSGSLDLLHTEWSPERLLAKGRMSGLQVGFSLDEYQRTVFQGKSLQLGATWDLELAERPRGLVHVFREGGDFVLQGDSPVVFGLENLDLNLALSDGRLALSALANGKRIGTFNAVATLALKGRGTETHLDMDAPMVGVLNADMPSIAWLGPMANQNLRTEGSLRGQFNITGTPARPVSAGFIKGEKLVVGLIEQGLRLDEGRLDLAFDAERVRLETLSFRSPQRMQPPDNRLEPSSGSGSLTGTGEFSLSSGKGHFDLDLARIATLQQPGQWLLVSGNAAVESGWDSLDIRAKLRNDAGFVGMSRSSAPSLSEDVKVRGREKPPQRFKINADVNFDFGENFILKAYGVDAWLEGLLRIRLAQGATPQASGSIRTREGFFNAYGQKLEIERGAVNFHGPVGNPGLNILARRRGLEVEAGVEVTGTAQRPRVRLVSEPNVPDQEKLAWILFGRPAEGSAADIGVLLSSTGASLGGEGEDLGAKIASGFGVDSLRLASSTNGPRRGLQSSVANNAVGSNAGSVGSSTEGDKMSNQVLSVGKRLGAKTYLSFEQNFLGTESVLKLSYSLTRFLSLVARAGTDNALDLNYSISFR